MSDGDVCLMFFVLALLLYMHSHLLYAFSKETQLKMCLLDAAILAHCPVPFMLFCKCKHEKRSPPCERTAVRHVPGHAHHLEGPSIRKGRAFAYGLILYLHLKQPPTDCPHLSRLPASNCPCLPFLICPSFLLYIFFNAISAHSYLTTKDCFH